MGPDSSNTEERRRHVQIQNSNLDRAVCDPFSQLWSSGGCRYYSLHGDYIAALHTITSPGKYCLASSLNITAGTAITINANDVVLDLNDFTITGGDLVTDIVNVAAGHNGITIRNGTVKDCVAGIDMQPDTNFALVENIRVMDARLAGISAVGNAIIVRNNHVWNTRGAVGDFSCSGILVGGFNNIVLDNDIDGTVSSGLGSAHGILVLNSDRSVVENNRIERTGGGAFNRAIKLENSVRALVVNNRIANSVEGILFAGSTGTFRDNLAVGCTTKYTGGTDAGNNQ